MTAVLFDTITTAQQSDMDRENADQNPADIGPWATELHDSDRPKALVLLLLALVAKLGAAARRAAAITLPEDRQGMALAVAAESAIASALSVFEAHADAIVADAVPAIVAALHTYVEDVTGADLGGTHATETALQRGIDRYLGDARDAVKADALTTVSDWHTGDGTDTAALKDGVLAALGGLAYQVERAARSEPQRTYIDLLKRGFLQARAAKVRREAQPSACAWCKSVAGVYEADDPDCYESHPACCCSWGPAAPGDEADFSMGGLPWPATVSGPVYVLDAALLSSWPTYDLEAVTL